MQIVISASTLEEARFALKDRIRQLSERLDECRQYYVEASNSASVRYCESALEDAQAAYEELRKAARS